MVGCKSFYFSAQNVLALIENQLQLNAHHYPVWASLARDHLAIMASSVSSERAFSSAGITISKRRSRLKGDIVEALQFLKCLLRRDLIFCTDPSIAPETDLEEEDELVEDENGQLAPETVLSASWDELWLDEEGDKVTDG
jgi:hypothetical protein